MRLCINHATSTGPIPHTTSTLSYHTMNPTRSSLVIWHIQTHFRCILPARAAGRRLAAGSSIAPVAAAATAAGCCVAPASWQDMAVVIIVMGLPFDGQPHKLVLRGCLPSSVEIRTRSRVNKGWQLRLISAKRSSCRLSGMLQGL